MTSNNIKNYFSSTTNGLNGSKERIEESTSKKTKSSKFQTTKRNTEHKSKESKECGYKSKDDTIKQNMLEVLKAVEKKKKCSKKRRLKKIKEQRDGDPDKEISEILGKSIHFSPTKPRRLVDSEDEENEQKIANGTLEVEESSEPLSVVSEVPTVISDTSFVDSDQIALQIEVMAENVTSITEKPKNAFQLMMQSRPAKTSPQMLDDSLLDEINSIKPSKRKSKSKKSNTPNNKIEINEKKEENEPETANLPSQSEVSTPLRRRGRPKKIQLNIVETNNNLQVISNGENLKNGTVQQEIKEKPTIPVSEQVMEVEANELVELKNEDVVNTNNKRKISGAGELEPKKRKTKEVEEKLLETPPKTASLDDSVIWQSGRPRRTCTAKIPTWEELLTPEKKTPEKNEKVLRKKKEKPADCIEIDESSPEKNQQTRPKVKLAPLFVKQLPRPSIDPLVVEARKNFLLSGIPEVLKVEIDKQRKFEDEFLGNELVAYPLISHVNKYQGKSPEVSFKNSKIKLAPNLEECDQQTNRFKPLEFGLLTTSSMQEVDQILKQQEISYVPAEKINDMKGLLLDLKTEHDYFPVFRCYKQLKAKKLSNGLMVEKYKPNSFDEYLINYKPVKELQNFLMLWNSKDRKYDSDDSNSNSSHRNNKCIVIYGPIGTGKTSSVYALANDLNFRVIEINAGLKRTGKKMLQELQEATQSHRIKKVQDVEDHEPENQKTVILIEDADVVFEDLDDGFVASLQTLVNVSKRPVILTALNENCSHLQKFQQGNSVFYNQPTRTNLTLYLNILCLVECHITTPDQMYQLLKINGRDLRKTINEIEFFVKSGNSRSSEDELIEFYGRGKQITKKRSWEKFELLESELAIIQLTRRKNEDRLAVCLEDEIAEFLRCSSFVDDNELLVKRSLCSELYTAILCLQTKSMALDYNSSMRQICRTEKSRLAMERKGSRFYHYLRNSVCTNTFSNTFFDEFCDSFQ